MDASEVKTSNLRISWRKNGKGEKVLLRSREDESLLQSARNFPPESHHHPHRHNSAANGLRASLSPFSFS